MIQRVCERCGAVIQEPLRRNLIKYKTYYTSLLLYPNNTSPYIEIDLCNSCRDLFDKWLNGSQEEG